MNVKSLDAIAQQICQEMRKKLANRQMDIQTDEQLFRSNKLTEKKLV